MTLTKPCKIRNGIEYWQCSKCKKWKTLLKYQKDNSHKNKIRSRCKKCCGEDQEIYRLNNYDRIREERKKQPCRSPERNKQKRAALKRELVEYYGNGSCACCGEREIMFLTIGHVDGGGCKHLKEIGYNLYFWLKRNDYPKGFQVLCFNCNRGKHLNNGVCPHQTAFLAKGMADGN